MKKKWLAALLGTALHVSLVMSTLACESAEERIIWMDSSQKSAMFIPEKLLQEVDWSKLPLKENDRGSLTAYLKRPEHLAELKRFHGREEPLCIQPKLPTSNVPLPTAKSLQTWLGEFSLSFVGEIKKVVPGWNSWETMVSQMVYVEVLEVARNTTDHIRKGSVLIYRVPYGSIHLKGTEICRDPKPNQKPPAEGDNVFLVGSLFSDNNEVFLASLTYPVKEGKINYQFYEDVQAFETIDLTELIQH